MYRSYPFPFGFTGGKAIVAAWRFAGLLALPVSGV